MLAMPSRAIVLALLVGCGATSGSSTSGRPLECGDVISNLFARSEAFAKQVWGDRPVASSQLTGMIEAVKPVIVQSCRDDHWSVELLACLDRSAVTDDPHKCNHLFTNDQAVGLARRTIDAVMRSHPERRS